MAAVEEETTFSPRIKVSENVEKVTNPGFKRVYRVYNEDGRSIADLIAKYDENVSLENPFRYVDPTTPWRQRFFEGCTIKELQVPIFKNGKLIYKEPSLDDIRAYVQSQLQNEVWSEEQRFENPHKHYLDFTPDYYDMKMEMLYKLQK